METSSVATQSGTQTTATAFDHHQQQQQQVAKNKRKKFNPKFMLTNNSSDDEGGGGGGREQGDDDEGNSSSCDDNPLNGESNVSNINEIIANQIPNADYAIMKSQNNNNDSPPPPQLLGNPFLSPSKLSLLQNLQQQQQLLQQAAISAIAPQFTQQLNPAMNLSETEAKFREFAFKTMQELLNIYGFSLSPSDVVEAMKQQQHLGEHKKHLIVVHSKLFANSTSKKFSAIRQLEAIT